MLADKFTIKIVSCSGFIVLLGGLLGGLFGLSGCDGQPWNSPYPPDQAGENILYSSFSKRPKHLDPARSYSSNEVVFTGQIYEPPLQYHFLKRPYQLEPLTAVKMPEPYYLDENGERIDAESNHDSIAFSVYEIEIKPGIQYQPHPSLAKDQQQRYRYHQLDEASAGRYKQIADFSETGSRELIAEDYVYQIKRLAHPQLHSPILGLMSEYIDGLDEYADTLRKAGKQLKRDGEPGAQINLREHAIKGVEVLGRYRYRIRIKGTYPQFLYWLAMPFFAPVPWEADAFYHQAGLKERNISLDWFPIGTGPYQLTVNNPNRQMILERNPNYRADFYPTEGEAHDQKNGYLKDAGKRLPMIDKVIYSLDKEAIPLWNKFLQGYYDQSSISSDSFDQAIQIGMGGEIDLTPELRDKNIHLNTAVATSIYYMGFNMTDPVVGGDSEHARLLRQAVSIAVDEEEYISIFTNGRGIPAQGPIPPGIFGYLDGEAGINSVVYDWTVQGAKRKSIETAKQLLAQAGYPNGRDENTGKPLTLYLDNTGTGPDSKAQLDWLRKQFAKLEVQLVIRSTDYNRFQDKMIKGSAQLFQWGWNADYPDPENFMFLLYGKNIKIEQNGENAANYVNATFDQLFEQMKNLKNGSKRQQLINQMNRIIRNDAPWVFGFHPKQFVLYHDWYFNAKPNLMANNTLKYKRIDPKLREQKRQAWNQPIVWPLAALLLLLFIAILPAVISYRRHESQRVNGVTDEC